jgi:transcriptional regulator of acetoin/glycerol metabolism
LAEPRPNVPTTRGRSIRRLAVARERFLARQPVESGAVRAPILASWQRSRDWNVAADPFELPYRDEPDRAAVLTSGAAPVIVESADELSGEPVSLILTDADGVVLQRRTGDGRLERRLDRASLCPGFSYAEQYAGTNGIGTALQGRRPASVFGHEHYVGHLEDLACAAAPITHPTSGKVLGVINLTGWRPDANAMMLTMVTAMARRVSGALMEAGGRRELALLHDYLAACARSPGPLLAVSSDLVMLNDSARASIEASDQDRLIALATEALSGGRARSLIAELPSGTRARLQCAPSWAGGPPAGVVRVQLLAPAVPAPRSVAAPTVRGMVGEGALWRSARQRVEEQFRAREWLLLEGEPGTGKLTLARAVHLAHTPGEHLRILDAPEVAATAASAFASPGASELWLAEVREELSGGGTVILRHVDRLPEPTLRALAALLAEGSEAWVVATRTGTGPATGALAAVVEHFPQSVEVPPLRHHVEDVRHLVPFLIARLSHGSGGLQCSPDAMRMLLRHRWPGNVAQLAGVLRRIVAHRRTGTITLADLPAEVQVAGRRTLTPLESIECDAIVNGLHAARGNRAEAARELGMSRATIYRKIRDYGIVAPPTQT